MSDENKWARRDPTTTLTAAEFRAMYEQQWEPMDENEALRMQGYAPGPYYCTCRTCKEVFDGDKRARVCKKCAVSALKREKR